MQFQHPLHIHGMLTINSFGQGQKTNEYFCEVAPNQEMYSRLTMSWSKISRTQFKRCGLNIESPKWVHSEVFWGKATNFWPCGFVIDPNAYCLRSASVGVVFNLSINPPFGLLMINCPNPNSYIICKHLKLQSDTKKLKLQHSYYCQISRLLKKCGSGNIQCLQKRTW